jgi:hypothetical protein
MENTPMVYAAINAVQDEMSKRGISKDKKNAQQGYSFRGIDDVYDALAPALAKHKLCIIPFAVTRNVTERQTKTGGTLFYVCVECEFHFVSAVDGSKHIAKTFGEAMDSADKATNKALSAAYKYAAFQAFCIPVDVQDADAVTPPEIVPDKYINAAQKKALEAIIAKLNINREMVKEFFFLRGEIDCKEDGAPTFNKLHKNVFEKMAAREDAFVKAFNAWMSRRNTGAA